MDRDLDAVVVARERLVDGVVDHLVDEVVEAARARRADVHPGPQPDRLEALEDRDVLCGSRLVSVIKKALQISHFAGEMKCIRNRRPDRPARGSPRRLSRPFAAAPRPRSARPARRPRPVVCAGLRLGCAGSAARFARARAASGSDPSAGGVRSPRSSGAARGSSAALRPSSNAHVAESACRRAACRRGAIRAGHALRAIVSPTAAGHARTTGDLARPPAAPKRASSRARFRRAAPSASRPRRESPRRAGRLERQRVRSVAVHDRLRRSRRSARRARGGGRASSSERTSSSRSERRRPALGEQLRLGEQQRQHGEPLLALRAEARAGRARPTRS